MLLTTALAVAAQESVPIDEEHFPDPAFRAWVAKYYTPESIPTAESVVLIYDGPLWNLKSIEGIEYFTNLKNFVTYDLPLKSVDLSKNKNLSSIGLDGSTSSLKVSSSLSYPYSINLFNCPITEESMDGLVDSIPEVDGTYFESSTFLLRTRMTMTESQIHKAIAKGWKVIDDGSKRYSVGNMSPSDATHFPDPYFRQWVSDYFQSLQNEPYYAAMSLDIHPVEGKNYESIASLEGLNCMRLNSLYVKGLPKVSAIDIKQQEVPFLYLGPNRLSMLDIRSMTSLQSINISGCELISANLSDIGRLETLDLSAHSNFTHLRINNCPKLTDIIFPSTLSDNGWSIDYIISNCNSLDISRTLNRLPTVPDAKDYAKITIISDEGVDFIPATAIEVARQKGWTVIIPQLSAVSSIRSTDSLDDYFTLSGQRLPAKPARKGIYVRKGGKILIQD